MFYSTQILAKKGPLGTIWIAAHLDRRLKRSQVFEANISSSVDSIINPEAPLALRLSGQLLLGVVKIYSRKVGYLYSDCNDAVARIASSLSRHGGGAGGAGGDGGDVDLPEDDGEAVLASITLPEGTSGESVAEIVAALNAGGVVGGRFFNNNNSALDAFAASIELGGAANFSLTGDSFLIADEVSTLLPSSMLPGGNDNGAFDPTAGGNGARFALSGRDIERALSGSAGAPFADVDGDVETLRDASALPDRLPPASGLFGDDGGGAGGDGAATMATTKILTEGMEPPPDYYDDDDDGGGFGGGEYGDDGDVGLDTPGSGLPQTPDGGVGSPALVGTAALLAAAKGGPPLRRKRPRLDVDEQTNRPTTQLVNADIRRLLQDPSPLMRSGAGASSLASLSSSLGAAVADLIIANAAAARAKRERSASDRVRSLLARPTFAPFMAPELYDVVVRCAPPPAAAPPRKPRGAAAAAQAGDGAEADAAAAGDFDDAAAGAQAFADDGWGGGFEGDDDDEDDYVGGGFGGICDGADERDGSAENNAEGDGGDDSNPSSSSAHSAAITRRTRAALDRLQGEWGSDARRLGPAAATPASLDALTRGSTRLDAARWFFEVLVLRSRGFVDVSQGESYADVEVRPRAMAFDEGVLGSLAVASTPVAAV